MIYDVIVIGGGPAGLAASIKASENNHQVMLVEREAKLGGILKQCIHDGFGLIKFKTKLTGPEYANHYLKKLKETNVVVKLFSYVTRLEKNEGVFFLTIVNKDGVTTYETKNIILATGCRERTKNQIFIAGSRGVGIYTAGCAQYIVNILGLSPATRAVILGSGDIGLIMARRLTLEGAKVLGVYEIKNTPSGLERNVEQCLHDFQIPLFLKHTITRIIGKSRVEAVEICEVDDEMKVIKGTEKVENCDCVILAVGLIPENEIAQALQIPLDYNTKGPIVDQRMMTMVEGVFACGNSLHVHDLVDYVSENAEIAGNSIQKNYSKRNLVEVRTNNNFLYVVPQMIDITQPIDKIVMYFRPKSTFSNCRLIIKVDNINVLERNFERMIPSEMERLVIDFSKVTINNQSKIEMRIEV